MDPTVLFMSGMVVGVGLGVGSMLIIFAHMLSKQLDKKEIKG